ncbi:triosephosphate isomerase [Tsukamurella asaccharolytica]|uniref:Triosephosphate isomerase n=2 Tax=Tsukamurella asaccharolytica TaxID=2592067 RepID=A0A5C5R7H0_9ACTN|nr:triosephosphate isomerase [Tsukamurella asaccharolytica]
MTKTLAEARQFVERLQQFDDPPESVRAFFLPAHTSLAAVDFWLGPNTKYLIGAQNADWAEEGPRTGEVSMGMVADAGAQIVEVGHAERRAAFGETDEVVAAKVTAALQHGLIPLICVGESAVVRRSGAAVDYAVGQLRAALAGVSSSEETTILVAYEPIWAIGSSGRPALPEEVSQVTGALRETLVEHSSGTADAERVVLYGGSVRPDNAADLLACSGVGGLFIGRAAWDADGFRGLVSLAARAASRTPPI